MEEKAALEILKGIPLFRMEKGSSNRSELGEAFFVALNALEKQIPMKPSGVNHNFCPCCMKFVVQGADKYCPACGQRLG